MTEPKPGSKEQAEDIIRRGRQILVEVQKHREQLQSGKYKGLDDEFLVDVYELTTLLMLIVDAPEPVDQAKHIFPRANVPHPAGKDDVVIEVAAGLCTIAFRLGVSTGATDDTRPGVGFEADVRMAFGEHGEETSFWFGNGVIRRSDTARLRDMLEIFLKTTEPGKV